ncbi:unnamed protein product [Closterium sp. NIES-54]
MEPVKGTSMLAPGGAGWNGERWEGRIAEPAMYMDGTGQRHQHARTWWGRVGMEKGGDGKGGGRGGIDTTDGLQLSLSLNSRRQ